MAKRGLTMAPFVTLTEDFRALELRDLFPQGIVRCRNRKLLDGIMTFRLMNCHVENTKVELAEVEQSIIDMLRPDQVLNNIVWNLFRWLGLAAVVFLPLLKVFGRHGRVVLAERLKL